MGKLGQDLQVGQFFEQGLQSDDDATRRRT